MHKCTHTCTGIESVYFPFRIFNHPNILPVLACCNQPPNLVVISQFMPYGSLFNVLHGETGKMCHGFFLSFKNVVLN